MQWVRSGLEGLEALHAMRPHNLSRLVSSGRGHSDNPANLLCHHNHHILQLNSTSGSTKCRSWRNIMETIVSHTFIVVYDEARGSLLVVLCRDVFKWGIPVQKFWKRRPDSEIYVCPTMHFTSKYSSEREVHTNLYLGQWYRDCPHGLEHWGIWCHT